MDDCDSPHRSKLRPITCNAQTAVLFPNSASPVLTPVTEKILDRDPMEELRRAFALFDDDHSGKITLKNLRRVAKELGEHLGDEELQAMIDEFDMDGDGEISQEEFIAIMLDGE